MMHIAIIGGGASGLCAARHISAPGSGMTCVLYEQTDKLGGTWVYTEKTDKDEYGLPIHSSMYKNLRTNLPKQTMEFPGFPWKQKKSFLTAQEVLDYFNEYVEHFNLREHVKFNHYVTSVTPAETGWVVTSNNLKRKELLSEHFDAVIVASGHYSVPFIPSDIKGLNLFEGQLMHSHNYRIPEVMSGKSVLIIGGGPSGIDICWDMSKYASKIFFTHHSPWLKEVKFPCNVFQMPEVVEVRKNEVVFEDNSSCQVDVILLCTGYKYSFPFLTLECGITVEEDSYVHPMYKGFIHACKPTLCIIGLLFVTFLIPLFDTQVRCFLNTLTGTVKLPSTTEMLENIARDVKQKQEEGIKIKNYHKLGPGNVQPYMDSLCKFGHLQPLPRVIFRIYENVVHDRKYFLESYREVQYCIIDDVRYSRNGVIIE